MSNAREIAKERFAKGEINEEELKSILNKLPDESVGSSVKKGFWTLTQFFGGGFLVFIVIGLFAGSNSKGLEVANLGGVGSRVNFDIVNSSSKTGDVVTYIKINGSDSAKCIHAFPMKKGNIRNLTMRCNANISGKKFSFHYIWADKGSGKKFLPIAKRINVNW